MKRLSVKKLYAWLFPLMPGLMLILCIRAANDIPFHQHYDYWTNNSLPFLLVDVFSILVYAYPATWMLRHWYLGCKKRGWSWKVEYGVVLITTPLSCLLVMWLSRVLQGRTFNPYDIPVPLVVSLLFVAFAYTFFRYQMQRRWSECQRLQLETVKNDQLSSELKYLKAQYHPHFLFNVLNTVYFQIDEQNEQPRRTLEKLSSLLRYQLYNNGNKVKFSTEIEHLKQYIDLWRLRCSERLRFSMYIDETLADEEVYPLLLVPLVENAFKYVGGDYHIVLNLRREERKVCFFLRNSVPLSFPEGTDHKVGIGIENLRRRLALLYPDCHSLEICRQDGLYDVKLILPL